MTRVSPISNYEKFEEPHKYRTFPFPLTIDFLTLAHSKVN